eukprot:203812-Chlamydomonas_euryale.AAC.5
MSCSSSRLVTLWPVWAHEQPHIAYSSCPWHTSVLWHARMLRCDAVALLVRRGVRRPGGRTMQPCAHTVHDTNLCRRRFSHRLQALSRSPKLPPAPSTSFPPPNLCVNVASKSVPKPIPKTPA